MKLPKNISWEKLAISLIPLAFIIKGVLMIIEKINK